jgi:hypothetical protein
VSKRQRQKASEQLQVGGTKCTPELTSRFVHVWPRVGSIKKTCALLGISVKTYYSWSDLGDKGVEPYATFVKELVKAKPQLILNLHEKAEEGITMRPDMAIRLLEVHQPHRFNTSIVNELRHRTKVIEEALRLIKEQRSGQMDSLNRAIDITVSDVQKALGEAQAESDEDQSDEEAQSDENESNDPSDADLDDPPDDESE